MARKEIQDIHDTLQQALDLMKKEGADYAEASFSTLQERQVKVRHGVVESLEASRPMGISLSLRIGDKSESISLCSRSLADLRDSVVQLASATRRMPDNPYDRPLETARISPVRDNRSLDLIDRTRVSLATLIEDARAMEAAALAVPGVSLSHGGSSGWYRALFVNLDSRGHQFVSESTGFSRRVAVIARTAQDQRINGEHSSAVYYTDLMDVEDIGREAGIQAVQALNPTAAAAGNMPVVFHPDIGTSLLAHCAAAINGRGARMKSSFLCDAMDDAVFAPGITVCDDPHLPRGMDSTRFSNSGMATKPMTVIEKGVLRTWFMGLEDARRLGLENAAHVRGHTNLTIEPGALTPDELVADIKDGLYVTGLMGQGVDLTNGQYSRAAHGFRIKDGRIDYSHPIANVSISSNLKKMFMNMSAANDLNRLRGKVSVPTLRVDGMSVA